MAPAHAPERGTSWSPARAAPIPGRHRRRLASGLLAGAVAGMAVAGAVLLRPGGHHLPSEPAARIPTPDGIEMLEARTAAEPTDLAAWQQLSRLYVQRASRTGDPTDYDLARRALDEAGALAPGDHVTTVTVGVLALSLHDFGRARDLAIAAHEQVPEDADALAILVDASIELGRYDEAETYVATLLERRPGSAALSRLSYLRELHGDAAGARVAMVQAEQAAGSAPDRAVIATLVGDLLLAGRDLTGAAEAYDRASRNDPGLLATDIGRARLAAAEGQLDAAITALGTVVERSPAPASATLLGELQQAAGRDADAAASFELARAGTSLLASAGSTVDLETASFLADHGDPSDALELAERAYRARRTVFTADAMGWALTRAGRPADALRYVEEALRLDTRAPGLHAHAALTYAATDQHLAAATELEVAFASSAWLTPSLRPEIATLADRLGVAVPADWRP